jgi:hypothetical protein
MRRLIAPLKRPLPGRAEHHGRSKRPALAGRLFPPQRRQQQLRRRAGGGNADEPIARLPGDTLLLYGELNVGDAPDLGAVISSVSRTLPLGDAWSITSSFG